MNLTAINVHTVFKICLFKEDENKDNAIIGEGVKFKVLFHPERLKFNTPIIQLMLDDLSPNFKRSIGQGWSFLNMCDDKNGNQWTDLNKTMDELVCLGNAIGVLHFVLPREMWCIFPANMPYIVINDKD